MANTTRHPRGRQLPRTGELQVWREFIETFEELRSEVASRLLAERGRVVYLQTSVAQQAERVRQGRARPLLSNVGPTVKLEALMQIRAPLYVEIAERGSYPSVCVW